MKQKGNLGKDWSKAARAFARQAYGKKKAESLLLERRVREWAADDYWDD